MRMELSGKRALVTGASSGIGREIAKELAKHGVKLAITARRKAALDELAAEVGGAVVLEVDLSRRGAAAELAARATEALGGVDLLVNNAGVGIAGTQTVVADDDMARELFETNYWTPLALTRALAPAMVARGDGAVANVTSIASVAPFPLTGHYASSKAALALATDTLRAELRGTGVHVLQVVPGPVETAMLAELKQVPGVPLDRMPRGDAPTLARKVVRALERRRDTVVYPGSLALVRVLPTVTQRISAWFGRSVDVSDRRAIRGGSTGDPIAVAARAEFERAGAAR